MKTLVYSTFWRYWFPPLIWALVIMGLSGDYGAGPNSLSILKWLLSWITALDHDTVSLYNFRFRKVLHVVFYGILSVLWFRALMTSHPNRRSGNMIVALGLCLVVALIDEGRQYLAPSRTGSLGDVALDMAGAVLFTFFTARYWKKHSVVTSEAKPPISRSPSAGPDSLQCRKKDLY